MPNDKSDDGCGSCLVFLILVCLGPPGWVLLLAFWFLFICNGERK